ncbi:hypothetical protein T265_15872, partial [Opisthorchis viverrini]
MASVCRYRSCFIAPNSPGLKPCSNTYLVASCFLLVYTIALELHRPTCLACKTSNEYPKASKLRPREITVPLSTSENATPARKKPQVKV